MRVPFRGEFLAEAEKKVELIANLMAWKKYYPPNEKIAQNGMDNIGECTEWGRMLKIGDVLQIEEVVLQTTNAFPLGNAFQLVKAKVLTTDEENQDDSGNYYFWIIGSDLVYVKQLSATQESPVTEPATSEDQPPAEPSNESSEGILIEIDAGQSMVVELGSGSGASIPQPSEATGSLDIRFVQYQPDTSPDSPLEMWYIERFYLIDENDSPQTYDYNSKIKDENSLIIDDLKPGIYTVSLSEHGNEEDTKIEIKPHLRLPVTVTLRVQYGNLLIADLESDYHRYLQNWRIGGKFCTYNVQDGNNAVFYNDAATNIKGEAGVFHEIEKAIDEAEYFIFIAGWSVHPFLELTPNSNMCIGKLLLNWATIKFNSGLIAIHTWDHTNIASIKDKQNDHGDEILKEILTNGNQAPNNLLWRASSRTGKFWSHHQKFIVMDYDIGDGKKGLRAFIGGLDLAKGRFDWPDHELFQPPNWFSDTVIKDEGNYEINQWYNSEFYDTDKKPGEYPRQPWHDVHCQVKGPAAWDILREFVGRWRLDPAYPDAWGDDSSDLIERIEDRYNLLMNSPQKFKKNIPNQESPIWNAQVYRSMSREHWADDGNNDFKWKWNEDLAEEIGDPGLEHRERSILKAYQNAIDEAEKFIYIETQYFIGSGLLWQRPAQSTYRDEYGESYTIQFPLQRPWVQNDIPQRILKRIKSAIDNREDFHVYLILPMFPEGSPKDYHNQAQRDLQWRSIECIVRGVQEYLENNPRDISPKNWKKYLTLGFLAKWCELENDEDLRKSPHEDRTRMEWLNENKRYMIYVHSKLMIVDDRYVIIGSANLNDRSLKGDGDSEICIGLFAGDGFQEQVETEIRKFRFRLWEEHFGVNHWGDFQEGDFPPQWYQPEIWEQMDGNNSIEEGCAKKIQFIGKENYELLKTGGESINRGHFCRWPIDGHNDGLGLLNDTTKVILDGIKSTNYQQRHCWDIWPPRESHNDMGSIIE